MNGGVELVIVGKFSSGWAVVNWVRWLLLSFFHGCAGWIAFLRLIDSTIGFDNLRAFLLL